MVGPDHSTDSCSPLEAGWQAVEKNFSLAGRALDKRAARISQFGRKVTGMAIRRTTSRRRLLISSAATIFLLFAVAILLVTAPPWRHPPVLQPLGLTATTRNAGTVILKWNNPLTGPEPDSYQILREWALIATIPGTTREYLGTGLALFTSYKFQLVAVRGGIRSPRSKPVLVAIAPPSFSAALPKWYGRVSEMVYGTTTPTNTWYCVDPSARVPTTLNISLKVTAAAVSGSWHATRFTGNVSWHIPPYSNTCAADTYFLHFGSS